MAGAGYKLFNTGDVLTAAQVNTYLQEQAVMRFANAAARTTALSGVLAEGMMSYLDDTNSVEVYNGSAWVSVGSTGDITGVTAGTGISGGGTSGDVTITNSMATAINAKADLIVGTANDSFDRLAVGSNGDTLVANSSASVGLSYSAGVGFTQPIINSGFDIWQRGTSIAMSTTAYTADRWNGWRGVAGGTVSRQTTSDTTNLPNIQYCARVQRDSGNSATNQMYFGQTVETINSIPFAGKQVTFSFYARKGANYSSASDALNYILATGTGTDQNYVTGSFTGSTNLINATATLTTTWQRFTATATIATNVTEMAVQFSFTPVGTAGAADFFEVTGVQIDLGPVALPYRRSGGTIAGELAACQRYYYRVGGSQYAMFGVDGFVDSATNIVSSMQNPTTMRVTATSVEFSAVRYVDFSGTAAALTALTISSLNSTPHYTSLSGTTTGATAGRGAYLGANNNANAYIGISAEL